MKLNPATLRLHPLLALLPPASLQRLLSDSATAEYAKGTVLFRQGDRCEAIYIIVSGRCETQTASTFGPPEIEEVFGPGDTLGERAFLHGEAHRSTATVSTRGILLRLPAAELESLLAQDSLLAGQFSRLAARRPAPVAGPGTRVRRVATLLAQTTLPNAPAIGRELATALQRLTDGKVLLLRLTHEGEVALHSWVFREPRLGGEFLYARETRREAGGYDELRLPVEADRHYSRAIAPLLGECGRHYDYVLVQIDATLPDCTIMQCLIQADLSYVLLQPSIQCLYDFQLLTNALRADTGAVPGNLKPIVLAEGEIEREQTLEVLQRLGLTVHSFARGFPLQEAPAWPDRRFALHINRLAREIARCRIGLALSSGSAKGLAHAGVIQVLEEQGIEVDAIAGSSMGAYVGALWAYGLEGPALEKIAREHEGRWGYLSLLQPSFPPRRGFIGTNKISRRLRRSLGDAQFSEMVRPLRIVATRLETLERIVFAAGDVAHAVEASIAIPGICVPVRMPDGETYVDGGVTDPLPVDVLEEMGIERIIAVNVIPTAEQLRTWRDELAPLRARRRWSLPRWLNSQLNYFAAGNVFDTIVQSLSGAQMLMAEAAGRRADLVLRPIAGDSRSRDFSHPGKFIQLGRQTAEAHLPQLLALTRSSHEIHPQPSPVRPNLLRAA